MYSGNLKKIEVSGACPICYGDMDDPKEFIVTKCSHAFHEKCMTIYFADESKRTICPYCRQMPIPMMRAEELPDGLEENPYIECKMLRALRNGDVDYIHEALLAEPQAIDRLYESKMNNVKYSILTLAAIFGQQDLVVFLLGKVKQESIDEFSSDGLSALSAACLFGHAQIAKLLLDANAKVNNTNPDGKNALWFAASAGDKDLVELLVKSGSSVTNRSTENVTALFMAAQKGHLEVVDYLLNIIPQEELKEYIHICSSSATTSATALYMAAQAGHADIVSSLISAGADPDQPLNGGQVPLHTAASSGHVEVVQILIAKGANTNFQGANGVTALAYAAAAGHGEICEYLLGANANPDLGPIFDPVFGHEEGSFRRQVGAVEIARANGYLALANYIENYPR